MISNNKYFSLEPDSEDDKIQVGRANLFYCLQIVIFAILCIIILNVKNSWIQKISNIEGHSKTEIGISFSLRVSLALSLWFFVHFLMTLGNRGNFDSCQTKLHTTFLLLHEIILIGDILGCLFMPEKFTTVYYKMAIFLSILFFIFQYLAILDSFEQMNNSFFKDQSLALPILILVFFSCFSLSFFVLCFIYFRSTENIIITCLNIIVCIIIAIVACLSDNQSVITATFVSSYASYLTFTGFYVEYGDSQLSSKNSMIIFMCLSAFFLFIFFFWSSVSLTGQVNLFTCEDVDEEKYSLSYFHVTMVLASFFMGMLVTNWCDPDGSHSFNAGTEKWIKWSCITACWICFALYVWGFIARRFFPDRTFD